MSEDERRGDKSRRARNHLAAETSPYLLQHASNPVDWYPWGPEAIEKARREDRPIFLSIGYSACHWCHVMERESFENEEIAAFLNAHFVSIKVDREERPDLDDLYMSAVQILGGQGGWPLSVFLTPELQPFFGGTYFPPDDRFGRPGFRRVLDRLLEVYGTRRAEIDRSASQVAEQIGASGDPGDRTGARSGGLSAAPIEAAVRSLLESFDRTCGGFGGAPKFPHSMGMQLLLRWHERHQDPESLKAVRITLDRMAAGGIYDHLGGGFHRYSTDAHWLVPHFEKMLYDQALLSLAYLEAWQCTRAPLYERVVRETLEYVLREMTGPEGGFYSTQDADSEGEEGRFFLWKPAEIDAVLGSEDGVLFRRAFDVDEAGNFEGRSILHRTAGPEALKAWTGRPADEIEGILDRSRERLRSAREARVHPGRDEKVLSSWNGLMISAFARSGRAFAEPRFVLAAGRSADFVLDRMMDGNGLLRVWKDGRSRVPAFLEDYAGLANALVDVYEATFLRRYLEAARELCETMIRLFGADPTDGGMLYNTSRFHTDLIVRLKSAQDGSTPSGNSMAACALLRLGRLAGRDDLERRGEGILHAAWSLLERAPGAFHQMLLALDLHLGPRQEIVVAGPLDDARTMDLRAAIGRAFLPRAVEAWTGGEGAEPGALLEGKTTVRGVPAVYVCRDFACDAPVTDPVELERTLGGQAHRE